MTISKENMNLNDLNISATEETPEVLLSASSGKSFLKGRSLPENAFEFYRSSSSRFLFEMLHALDQSENSASYVVRWQTDPEDELMIEKGEELQRLLRMKIEIV
jgi:hypothetical protein